MAHEIINGLYEEVIRDGVDAGPDRGTFPTWLQRDDWRAAHPGCKALCHQSLRTLLGARR
jgi:hypothetical protein